MSNYTMMKLAAILILFGGWILLNYMANYAGQKLTAFWSGVVK